MRQYIYFLLEEGYSPPTPPKTKNLFILRGKLERGCAPF
ncbi:hypothetical protein CSE_05300 [Caldisericum exile AZM16c01]|uniref:Uncharacterized protein n=1 Tax=Caldisericum exile (strain DSM 21853 / NBRC 104410 / AZM16c01) TaxID=511051 RepID=A0A7U6GE26_CALEA|nr:hypothetical protein CSE_05300 [Caldisericum exile AZM16c01]